MHLKNTHLKSSSWASLAFAGLAISSAFTAKAGAQSVYKWTGGNNTSWNNAALWDASAPYAGNPGIGAPDIVVDVSQLDLTAARTVNLNNGSTSLDRTVGTIKFGDSNATNTTTYNWILGTNSAAGTFPSLFFGVSSGTGTVEIVNGTTTFNPIIAGSSGLTKIGAGTLILNNPANTITGGIYLNAGELTFVTGALGNNTITTGGNTTLNWSGTTSDISSRLVLGDGFTLSLGLSNIVGENTTFATALPTGPLATGGITKQNAGNLTISAANTFTGGTRVNNGRLLLVGGDNRLSAAGSLSFGNGANFGVVQLGDATRASNQTVTGLAIVGTGGTGNAVVGGAAANSVLTVNNAGNISAANAPTLGGSGPNENNLALIKTGAGSLTLGKAATFSGDVDLQGGKLIVTSSNAVGTTAKRISISGSTNAPSLQLNSAAGVSLPATLALRTSNDDPISPALVNTAGANLVRGDLALASGGYGGGQTRVLVNGGSLTLAGNVAPAADAISERTLILDGVASTVGVATGSLADNGATKLHVVKEGAGTWSLTGANTYTGTVQVNGGRLNLSTTHTGNGAIAAADSTTVGITLSVPGQSLAPASLTLGGSGGANLAFDLGSFGNPTAPLVQTGSFTIQSGSTITIAGTGLSVGSFPLIKYTGSLGGAGAAGLPSGNLPAAAVPSRVIADLVDDAAHGIIALHVSQFDIPRWTGQTSNIWNINDGADPTTGSGAVNWRESSSGTATRYLQSGATADSVIFDDLAGAPTEVVLSDALSPNSLTVKTSVNSYVFTGSGRLTGGTSLLKQGSTVLTLANTGGNDFTGAITVAAGTLQVGDGYTVGGGQLGSGPLQNEGTLWLRRPDDFALTNVLTGSGLVEKQGSNVVTLSGNSSTFAGPIVIGAGFLKISSPGALGSSAAGTSVASGAELQITGFSIGEPVKLQGGTLSSLSGTVSTLTGPLTLEGGGKAAVVAGTLTLSGAINGAGGLTKSEAGTLALTGTSAFAGGLTLNAGTVLVVSDQAYSGGTTINQGTVQIGAANGKSTAGSLGTGDVLLNPASGSATLTILRGDNALVVPNSITSSGAGANSIVIGLNGLSSPSGTVTFSGVNSFTGNINIAGGALRITNSSALGVGPKSVSIASNARPSLQLDGSAGNITLAPEISFTASSDGTQQNTASNPGAIVNVAGDNQVLGKISLVNGSGGEGKFVAQAGTLLLGGTINADGATGVRNLLLGGSASGKVNGSIANGLTDSNLRVVGVIKDGAGLWELAGESSYTGATAVNEGELKVSGSLSGTVSLRVAQDARLRLGASNILNDAATLTLAGGTFQTGGFSEVGALGAGIGALSVTASSTVDFGAGTGSSLLFAGLGTHTAGTLLSILNWSNPGDGSAGNGDDRLLFTGSLGDFTSRYTQADVLFNGLPGYSAWQIDSSRYEVTVASVPEPGTLSLLLPTAMLSLGRTRRRRRA